jgi:hypothetical protein
MDDDTWALLYTELQWILEQENPQQDKISKVNYSNPIQKRKDYINKILK